MLVPILLGLALTSATIAIHAIGTMVWVSRFGPQDLERLEDPKWGRLYGVHILCSTSIVLTLLHTVEIMVWALAYLVIPDDQIETIEEAIYFSMVTFGSLGYGDIVIDSRWRMLSGIECMAGLLVFGLSTALLLSVVQRIWWAKGERPK